MKIKALGNVIWLFCVLVVTSDGSVFAADTKPVLAGNLGANGCRRKKRRDG